MTINLTDNIIAVQVPEGSTGHRVVDFMGHDVLKFEDDIFTSQRPLPDDEWHLIGKLSDCLENEALAEKVVEKCRAKVDGQEWDYFIDYTDEYVVGKATESLQTLAASHSLDLTKTWVLLTNKKETV